MVPGELDHVLPRYMLAHGGEFGLLGSLHLVLHCQIEAHFKAVQLGFLVGIYLPILLLHSLHKACRGLPAFWLHPKKACI